MNVIPAYASSSDLLCRITLSELDNIKAEVEMFNASNVAIRRDRKLLFKTFAVNGDSWSHIFSQQPRETMINDNQKRLEWFYQWTELSFRKSQIKQKNKFCAWMSSKHYVDVFEIHMDAEDKIVFVDTRTVR